MIGLVIHKLLMLAPTWLPSIVAIASGGGGHEAAGDAHGGGHSSGPPHLPSLLGLLFAHDSAAYLWSNPIYAIATSLIMCSVSFVVYRKRTMIPGKLQNFLEVLVEGMFDFFKSIMGKEAKRYLPFLGTLFFYILINNFWGLIPLGHSPSTSINVTATLAITVFLYAQWTGISRLGFVGWLDHLAGSPRDVISWCLVPLMVPLHIIGELAKPLSLALRLFGNITGEDVLVAAFVGLGIAALSFMHSPVGLPLNLPFIFLGMLLSLIQALVFTLLSSIYILMMLPHEEHH
ncbi:MAG: F0F1 ATP synthase subunit A [candidate division Zixibacteria bacterium]|nr:F0F1 ATP synthase subunit A [candidate division Zixibacteria bacterium]